VFYDEAQLPSRQLVAHETSVEASHKPVSGQSIDVDSSVATSAFVVTNPTDESNSSRFAGIWKQFGG
jgi:hypothetical protein